MFEKAWMGPKMQNLAAHNKKNIRYLTPISKFEFIKKYYYFI